MNDYSTFLSNEGFATFLFHGVIRRQRHAIRNYTAKHIELDRFVKVLRSLSANGSAVSMPDIVEATAGGRALPKRAFAITFDDGFENNYSVAAPVLAELRIPATFYLTTNFIESNESSWIDLIEYAFEAKAEFSIDLPLPGRNGSYSTREQKLRLLDQIRRIVKANPDIDPYEFANDIWRQIGVSKMVPDRDLDQKMNWSQACDLGRNRLFTVGGHGHTHRILEYLAQPELEREISLSLEKLEENLGFKVMHYSYPEGLANCYSDRVIRVLKERGIVCAPSAEHGINRLGDDLFTLKRVMVA